MSASTRASKQRYVIMCRQVFRYEDKTPFPISGKSILGALEYDKENRKVKCHECGEWFKFLSAHLPSKHKLNAKSYKLSHGLDLRSPIMTPDLSAKLSIIGKRNLNFTRIKTSSIATTPVGSDEVCLGKPLDCMSGDSSDSVLQSQPLGLVGRRKSREMDNILGLCPAQVIVHILDFYGLHNRCPSSNDINQSIITAAKSHFGSWSKACSDAGIEPNSSGSVQVHFPETLKESLIDFYALNGRLPKCLEFGTGRLPSRSTYNNVFGNLRSAFKEAGFGHITRPGTRYGGIIDRDRICRLHEQGLPKKTIAEVLNISLSSVVRTLNKSS
jgi:hypothetical protein